MQPHALRSVPELSEADFGRDLLRCLCQPPHTISPKYLYDGVGSRLFEQICELPEYYPTRAEVAILQRHAGEIARLVGPDADLVEFGAGSLAKIRILLAALERPARFTAVDISGDHLQAALADLQHDHPKVEVAPIIADFTCPEWLPLGRLRGRPQVGFFPGSTIGNLSSAQAQRFLTTAARLLKGGGLLIGVDLVKDPVVLHAAYNDNAGVTAAFNLNLLERANRELGADFDPAAFRHYAYYNVAQRRVEMHLVALRPQEVHVLGYRNTLREGESIHTENSHKYTVESFQTLATNCGFRPTACWVDDDKRFSLHWLTS